MQKVLQFKRLVELVFTNRCQCPFLCRYARSQIFIGRFKKHRFIYYDINILCFDAKEYTIYQKTKIK